MSTKEKLSLAIFILVSIFLLLFIASFMSGKPIHETLKSGGLSASSFVATIPKAQFFFYGIILLIMSIIILYHSVQKSYGLPDNSIQFLNIPSKIQDCRNVFSYKGLDGNYIDNIPGKDIPLVSKNQLTYGFWLYLSGSDTGVMEKSKLCGNDWTTCNFKKWKHIMHHGSKIIRSGNDNLAKIQTPGIWLSPVENNIVVIFNTQGTSNSELITLENIDVNKWVHVSVSLNNRNVSIYKNGFLERSVILKGEPIIIKTSNIYIANTGDGNGFAGLMYKGFYSNNTLSQRQIKYLFDTEKDDIKSYYKTHMRGLIYNNK
tara:strand:- start:12894 stop:13844 length:951 start_codon:yes stop_codon:yes gene_type:complete